MDFTLYEHPRSAKTLGTQPPVYVVVLGVAITHSEYADRVSYLVVDALVHPDNFVDLDYGVSPRFVPASGLALYVGED